MLFYNGRQKYNVTRNIWNLFSDPVLVKNLWSDADYQLINVHDIDDEELKKHKWAGTLQFFMKHIWQRDIYKIWQEIAHQLPQITELEVGVDYVKLFLIYTLTHVEENDKMQVESLLKQTLETNQGENVMVSVAQKLYNEGKSEGEARGKARGVTKVAINMLKQNLDAKLISNITGLTVDEIKKIQYSL